jgi:hypothetical protein
MSGSTARARASPEGLSLANALPELPRFLTRLPEKSLKALEGEVLKLWVF